MMAAEKGFMYLFIDIYFRLKDGFGHGKYDGF